MKFVNSSAPGGDGRVGVSNPIGGGEEYDEKQLLESMQD